MSAMDEFNRFSFERAKVRYNRAQYDAMSTDDWIALVEEYRMRADDLESVVAELKEVLASCE